MVEEVLTADNNVNFQRYDVRLLINDAPVEIMGHIFIFIVMVRLT